MGIFWSKRQQAIKNLQGNYHQQDERTINKSNLKINKLKSKLKPSHEQLTYGNAVFMIQQKDHSLIEQINEKQFQFFFQPCWSLEYKQFVNGNWSEVFRRMTQSSVQILALFKSGQKNIIQEIQPVKFTNLEILSLGGNNIQSIEALAWLDIDTLKTLRLNENFITNFGPLSKLKCDRLQNLILHNNTAAQIRNIGRIKFNSAFNNTETKKISMNLLHGYGESVYLKMHFDFSLVMKIQLNNDVVIYNLEQNYVKPHQRQALHRRFSDSSSKS